MEPKPEEELCFKSGPPLNDPYETDKYALTEDQFEKYMERYHPFLALAMKHYNKKIRDDKEEEYRFSHLTSTGNGRQTYYGELGYLRHQFWEAVPKTPGAKIKVGDSSTAGAKIFYARIHETHDGIHIPYCGIYTEFVDDSESCEICGLNSSEEFRKKAQELGRKKAHESEAGQENNAKSARPFLKAGLYPPLIPFVMHPEYEKYKQLHSQMAEEAKKRIQAKKGIPVSNSIPKSDINEGEFGPPDDERIAIIKEKEESIANLLSALKQKEKEMAEIKKQIQELQSQVKELTRVKS